MTLSHLYLPHLLLAFCADFNLYGNLILASRPALLCSDRFPCIKLIIPSLFRNQLVMCAALNNAALFQNHDTVRIFYGRQPMSDNKGSPTTHQAIHALLHQSFRAGVDGRCRFVQNQHRRICHGSAGNGQQLSSGPGRGWSPSPVNTVW